MSKAFYFLYYAAAAALLPFLALYYEQVGLSGRQIGLLVGIPPILMLVSPPLWGGLADSTKQHKLLLMAAIGGSWVMVLVLSLTTAFLWLIPVVFAYSFIRLPWLVLPVQLLHGPTFSAMWVAGASCASDMAPEGMGATAQGLFSSVIFGLGGTFGALLGGALYDSLGATLMFRWAGVGVLTGLFSFSLARSGLTRLESKSAGG